MTAEDSVSKVTAEVRVAEGIVRVEVRGVVTEPNGADAIGAAVRAAREAGTTLILFDIRALQHSGYHASVVQRADNAAVSGIAAFRVAILGEVGSPLLGFIETVASNRGLRARCFTEEAGAMRWLKASG
jgi:ABC-type sugar transport system substrate-binding protein